MLEIRLRLKSFNESRQRWKADCEILLFNLHFSDFSPIEITNKEYLWTTVYNDTGTESTSSWILTLQSEIMHNDCCYSNRGNKSGSRSLYERQTVLTDTAPLFCSPSLYHTCIVLIWDFLPTTICFKRCANTKAENSLTNHTKNISSFRELILCGICL